MNRFEYVLSGCNYSRLQFAECAEPELNAWIRSTLGSMQDIFDHNFSLLTNAYTEKSLSKWISDNNKFGAHRQYTDSGGLQIITLGLENTADIRNEIYKTQALYSDIAMCFDEIPLRISGSHSKKMDRASRWFDAELLEAKARATGKHVLDQINFFIDQKTSTKPILIIQGNCLDTYKRWCDYVLDEIPQDKWQYIGGVAIGSAAYGHGDLEEITKAFILKQLPIYDVTKHLHLLGVGSITRMIPYIITTQNGYYNDDLLISYDSTTHSSALFFGRYLGIEGKDIPIPKHMDHMIYSKLYDYVSTLFDMSDVPLAMFYDGIVLPTLIFKEKYGNRVACVKSSLVYILSSVYNFIKIIDKMKDKNALLSMVQDPKKQSLYHSIYSIKNEDDFRVWNLDIGRSIKTSRVKSSESLTLDSFWD